VQPPSISPAVVDWVSALGEVAGAVGTVAAVVVALWVSNRSMRQQRAEQADREAGQARLITVDFYRADGRWWVRTTNHSAAPVFDVQIDEVRHTVGTSEIESVPGHPAELAKLAAGQDNDRAVAVGDGVNPSTGDVVVLRFLDARGLRWRREGTAQPQRVLD
jgi:hypothetical protein